MTQQTYHGSCHCGAVRFEAELDFAEGTGKCNCRLCTKTRAWTALRKPEAFRVTQGEDALSVYVVGGGIGRHYFCGVCGVRTHCAGHLEQIGGDFVAIFLSALDDASDQQLVDAPVKFADGRNDNWWNVPAETRHL